MDLMERTSTTPHVLALALVIPAKDQPQPHTSAFAAGEIWKGRKLAIDGPTEVGPAKLR
jgi:hypothetical protein